MRSARARTAARAPASRATDELSTDEALDGRRPARGDRRARGRADRRRGLPARGLPRHRRARSRARGIRAGDDDRRARHHRRARAASMAAAGLHVSRRSASTGSRRTHDLMRDLRGSFASRDWRRSSHLRAAGIAHRVEHQPQPAQPPRPRAALRRASRALGHRRRGRCRSPRRSGRAADRPDAPAAAVGPARRRAARRRAQAARVADGIVLMPGNNLGYFGPEEATLRSLEPDATRSLARLPGRPLRDGHRVRRRGEGLPVAADRALRRRQPAASRRSREIWNDAPELAFARRRTVDDLWGFCRTCPFAATCMGGCTFTAHALFGRPGQQPVLPLPRAHARRTRHARAPGPQDGRAGHAVRQRHLRARRRAARRARSAARRRRRRW